jgi:hypothetical protein
MDQIIQKIVEIEDEAQGIVDSIQIKDDELLKQMNEQLSEIEQTIHDQTDRKISQINDRESSYLKEKLESVQDETEKNIETLNSVNEKNKDSWVETMYNNIISAK